MIRFHDLRHTTGSLLMMAGANPAAVQRILRHSAPRITTEVYGHLAPGYLRAEIDRLRATSLEAAHSPLAALVLQGRERGGSGASLEIRNTEESSASNFAGWTGLEPAASGVTGGTQGPEASTADDSRPVKTDTYHGRSDRDRTAIPTKRRRGVYRLYTPRLGC